MARGVSQHTGNMNINAKEPSRIGLALLELRSTFDSLLSIGVYIVGDHLGIGGAQ